MLPPLLWVPIGAAGKHLACPEDFHFQACNVEKWNWEVVILRSELTALENRTDNPLQPDNVANAPHCEARTQTAHTLNLPLSMMEIDAGYTAVPIAVHLVVKIPASERSGMTAMGGFDTGRFRTGKRKPDFRFMA